jgi:hypothetical protein
MDLVEEVLCWDISLGLMLAGPWAISSKESHHGILHSALISN